jgi:hypothetical protein
MENVEYVNPKFKLLARIHSLFKMHEINILQEDHVSLSTCSIPKTTKQMFIILGRGLHYKLPSEFSFDVYWYNITYASHRDQIKHTSILKIGCHYNLQLLFEKIPKMVNI